MIRCLLPVLLAMAALDAVACVSRVEQKGVIVELQCSPFLPEKRKVVVTPDKPVVIDGKTAYGPDGKLPARTVDSLKVSSGGRTFSMPPEMLRDLFDPRIAPQFPNSLSIQQAAGDMLLFRFSGGENVRAYDALWVLNTGKGEVTRFIYTPPGASRGLSMKGLASELTVRASPAQTTLPAATGITGRVIERLEDPPKP